MNFFRLKEYWHYRKVAKGRHGVHSPFVYKLIDEALRPHIRRLRDIPVYRSEKGEAWEAGILLQRIAWHLRYGEIVRVDEHGTRREVFLQEGSGESSSYKLFDCRLLADKHWLDLVEKTPSKIGEEDVVVLKGIHLSPDRKEAWDRVRKVPCVRLSLDFFDVGLLFFSGDFKEQQHFILKQHP